MEILVDADIAHNSSSQSSSRYQYMLPGKYDGQYSVLGQWNQKYGFLDEAQDLAYPKEFQCERHHKVRSLCEAQFLDQSHEVQHITMDTHSPPEWVILILVQNGRSTGADSNHQIQQLR